MDRDVLMSCALSLLQVPLESLRDIFTPFPMTGTLVHTSCIFLGQVWGQEQGQM